VIIARIKYRKLLQKAKRYFKKQQYLINCIHRNNKTAILVTPITIQKKPILKIKNLQKNIIYNTFLTNQNQIKASNAPVNQKPVFNCVNKKFEGGDLLVQ
jgi:hypothetical protein